MKERGTILVVDDIEMNRVILRETLKEAYTVAEAENGQAALEYIENSEANGHYIAAVLLDIVMPVMDGMTLLNILGKKAYMQKVPVILITSTETEKIEKESYDMGIIDIIRKPFDPYVVQRRVQNVVELYEHKHNLEELVQAQTKTLLAQAQDIAAKAAQLEEQSEIMVAALGTLVEYRNMETGQHINRVRSFTRILLEDIAQHYPEYALNPGKIKDIVSASAMHDIGKISIPDSILLKPGKLTPEEFEIMKTHAEKGDALLHTIPLKSNPQYMAYCYEICRHHHERWDGKGYPDHLVGDAIPISAQAVSVADVYDALTVDRCYKAAISHEKAVEMILDGQCGSFSHKIYDSFRRVSEQFREVAENHAKDCADEKCTQEGLEQT